MQHKTDEIVNIGRRLLEYEAGEGNSSPELADAAERCHLKLYDRLSRLLGSTTARVFLERAVRQTREKHLFLGVVEVQPDGSLKGLRSAVEGQSAVKVSDGFIALIDNVISLLLTFIGPDIVLAQVNAAWPQLSAREKRRVSQEEER